MKLYVNPNNKNEFQQGMSAPGMIQVPSQYSLGDLPYLDITGNDEDGYEFYLDSTQKNQDLAAKQAEKVLTEAIQSEYDSMNSDVYTEMYNVFGTDNANSAAAYEATWKLMSTSPSEFHTLGLTDGDTALDTIQLIQDYADDKLATVLTYAKYRMQRIEQFRAARSALLG